MMMMKDTVRPQVDMLREGMRNYHLDHKELGIQYPVKIIWRSVMVSDMRQNGFKLTEGVRQKRARGMHSLMGPNNMSGFDRHQMCMDVISWILEGDSKKREYDEALHWLADFLKYPLGFHNTRRGRVV